MLYTGLGAFPTFSSDDPFLFALLYSAVTFDYGSPVFLFVCLLFNLKAARLFPKD